jgi:hypothetical protein
MNYCSNLDCPARAPGGEPVAYDDNVVTCPACGLPLTGSIGAVSLRLSPLGKRVCVTLGILAICLVARHIALPTVKSDLNLHTGTSIMALGVRPLLFGYVLVELAALLVRSGAHGAWGGRRDGPNCTVLRSSSGCFSP